MQLDYMHCGKKNNKRGNMYIISLLVHEKKDVVLDQLKNFEKYFPNSQVVIHVSKKASFDISELASYLKNQVNNYVINPQQADTSWANIIPAHFLNIKYAYQIDKNAHILFHSSNDLFVRDGVENFLNGKDYIFNQRFVYSPYTYWWPGAVAKTDRKLTALLQSYDHSLIVGTQIEGSMFKIEALMDIIRMSDQFDLLDSTLHYPREEIIFSSLCNAMEISPDGLPYVLSEVHRFDRRLWQFFIEYKITYKIDWIRQIVNKLFFNSDFYKISERDIQAIVNNDYTYFQSMVSLYDGENQWDIFSPENLYAVKRVERQIDDPLRTYIRGLK